jgi:hypothetical protein
MINSLNHLTLCVTPLHKGYLGGDDFTTGNLVQYYNDKVSEHSNCTSLFCPYRDEIFDAGPDRGGSSIGGPLWTDFGVLEVAAEKHRLPPNIIQVRVMLKCCNATLTFTHAHSYRGSNMTTTTTTTLLPPNYLYQQGCWS